MKFKYPLFFILFFSFSVLSFSQDLIIKKNGEQINAKVGEINKKEVKYSLPDDPDLKVYTVSKDSLKLIRYANGKEISFEFSKYARGFIGIYGGCASALGAFASNDNSSPSSGYAYKTLGSGSTLGGVHLNLNAGFYVYKNVGLNLGLGVMVNGSNFGNDLRGNYYYNDHPDYYSGYFLAGPMYSFKFGKKLFLDTKIQGGVILSKHPSLHGDYSTFDSTTFTYTYLNYNFDADPNLNFCLSGGLSFRWAFSKRIGLSLSGQILSANVKTSFRDETREYGNLINSHSGSFYKPVTTLNLGLGIVYLFNRKN